MSKPEPTAEEAAHFSREAAAALNSAYFASSALADQFTGPDGKLDEDGMVAEWQKRDGEHRLLKDAVHAARTAADLPPEAAEVYWKALNVDADEGVWRERVYGDREFAAGISEEATGLIDPTPEDSALLASAIAEAVSRGDQAAAEKLAALAKKPWKIREALGQGAAGMERAEQEGEAGQPG